MKKFLFLLLTVFSLGFSVWAQQGNDSFFFESNDYNNERVLNPSDLGLTMPTGYIGNTDNTNVPLGSGVAFLSLFGVGYALMKRNRLR